MQRPMEEMRDRVMPLDGIASRAIDAHHHVIVPMQTALVGAILWAFNEVQNGVPGLLEY